MGFLILRRLAPRRSPEAQDRRLAESRSSDVRSAPRSGVSQAPGVPCVPAQRPGETVADLLLRVRLNLVSQRLQQPRPRRSSHRQEQGTSPGAVCEHLQKQVAGANLLRRPVRRDGLRSHVLGRPGRRGRRSPPAVLLASAMSSPGLRRLRCKRQRRAAWEGSSYPSSSPSTGSCRRRAEARTTSTRAGLLRYRAARRATPSSSRRRSTQRRCCWDE